MQVGMAISEAPEERKFVENGEARWPRTSWHEVVGACGGASSVAGLRDLPTSGAYSHMSLHPPQSFRSADPPKMGDGRPFYISLFRRGGRWVARAGSRGCDELIPPDAEKNELQKSALVTHLRRRLRCSGDRGAGGRVFVPGQLYVDDRGLARPSLGMTSGSSGMWVGSQWPSWISVFGPAFGAGARRIWTLSTPGTDQDTRDFDAFGIEQAAEGSDPFLAPQESVPRQILHDRRSSIRRSPRQPLAVRGETRRPGRDG